jgi:hypothetical protein
MKKKSMLLAHVHPPALNVVVPAIMAPPIPLRLSDLRRYASQPMALLSINPVAIFVTEADALVGNSVVLWLGRIGLVALNALASIFFSLCRRASVERNSLLYGAAIYLCPR